MNPVHCIRCGKKPGTVWVELFLKEWRRARMCPRCAMLPAPAGQPAHRVVRKGA